jgi:hypothetical protein
MAEGQVVFKLSGKLENEYITELEALIDSEGEGLEIVLDLEDLQLVGQDAITFLAQCEAENIALLNCAPYIREWVTLERGGR